jgi:hypothetical protein
MLAVLTILSIALLAAPLFAEAQPGRTYRIGILADGAQTNPRVDGALALLEQQAREGVAPRVRGEVRG